MKCTLFAYFALVIACVSAVSITDPVQATKWTFGKKWNVKWQQDPTGKTPNEGSATVYLYHLGNQDPTTFQGGDAVATAQVQDIKTTTTVELDLTSVPTAKYPPTSNYFIRIGDVGGSYSGKFTISGGTGAALQGASNTGSSVAPSNTLGRTSSISGTSKVTSTRTATKTKKASTSDAVSTYTFSVMAVVAAIIAVFM